MRRRMRGAQPAAAAVHVEPAAPPATTHPAAALEQRDDCLAPAEAAHQDTGSAAEPGLSLLSMSDSVCRNDPISILDPQTMKMGIIWLMC